MLRTRHHRNSSTVFTHAQTGIEQTKVVGDRGGNPPQAFSGYPKPSEAKSTTVPPRDEKGDDLEIITSSMSALKFVPPSIRFGRGGKRGGFSRS